MKLRDRFYSNLNIWHFSFELKQRRKKNRNTRAHYILFVSIKYRLFTNMNFCFHFCFDLYFLFFSKCLVFNGSFCNIPRGDMVYWIFSLVFCVYFICLYHTHTHPLMHIRRRKSSAVLINGIHLECFRRNASYYECKAHARFETPKLKCWTLN